LIAIEQEEEDFVYLHFKYCGAFPKTLNTPEISSLKFKNSSDLREHLPQWFV
jgi:hypothetical protein